MYPTQEMQDNKREPGKPEPTYTLQDLMLQCDLGAPGPQDLSPWEAMRSVGREYGAGNDHEANLQT